MCGIIGYIGSKKASEVILNGLKKLEYRGYDSAGIAVLDKSIEIKKDEGTVDVISKKFNFASLNGNVAIGHSRWATHGAPCTINAHPHSDCNKKVVLVHNGVIENYRELKDRVVKSGHNIVSDTDSEIIAHLIEEKMKNKNPFEAFREVLSELKGSYALAVLISSEREKIFVARKNSPLILGVGQGEMFCASDIPAMLAYTKTFVPLEDEDYGFISKHGYEIYNLKTGEKANRKVITVDWDIMVAEKGGYPHFMLKEINDQKHFVYDALAADTSSAKEYIDKHTIIDIVACGTSYHAGLLLSILLEKEGKRAKTYIASDYSYISSPTKDTLVIAITQSGETADVLQAVRYAKDKGAKVIAITNTVGSSITREAHASIYMNVGAEIGVAATKTFMAQLIISYLISNKKEKINEVPKIIEQSLANDKKIREIATVVKDAKDLFFLSRGITVPIAYEASLKFKEISYIHSEAYPGGELKHGTLSLIEKGVPVVIFAPNDETAQKILGNLKETKARGALVISFTDNKEIAAESDYVVPIETPKEKLAYPFSFLVPLQLFAYYTSVMKGNNPDKPRNLAKAVTVE
ncbi:MAG: glutamine--fructose-6-phosphate transaminase (isomerizing) [Candidatus Bilamarchaeaceae archaeon]